MWKTTIVEIQFLGNDQGPRDGIVSRNAGLWADLRWYTSYKIVHGLVDEDPSEVGNSGRATRRSTSQHRFGNITANKNCYRVFLFFRGLSLSGTTCPDISQCLLSWDFQGPNWHKRLALRPWSLVATTTTIEMTADPLCHISLAGALHRTDLDLDPRFRS